MAKKRRTSYSDIEQEYRRLRRNLLARIRYREKQGFKVDYTSKPKLKQRITRADVERLKESKLQINRYGEVVINPPRKQTRTMRDITRQDVSTAKDELRRYNQPPQAPRSDEEVVDTDLDYVGMVQGVLSDIKDKAEAYMDEYQPQYSMHWQAEEFYNAWIGCFELLIEVVDDELDRVGEARLNAYYRTKMSDIAEEVSQFVNGDYSEPDQVSNSSSMSQLEYLLKCP